MSIPIRPAPWRQVGWHEEAMAWTDAALARLGFQRTGPLEPRERPWSIVLTVETDAGRVFVKETAAALANDAGITALLAEFGSSLILRPLLAHPARRRMIL